jgi:hypothetical protein
MIPCHPALRSPLRVVKIRLSQVVNFRLSLLCLGIRSSGKELQDQLRTEVIPQLHRELEALKKRLERDRREEETKQIKGKLNELTAI